MNTHIPAITVSDLTVYLNNHLILDTISASVPKGSLTAIVGPNGAGKSTLINTVAGIIRPTHGTITILHGQEPQSAIAFVPQTKTVDWSFPLRVIDVVRMGRYPTLGLLGSFTEKDHQLVSQALEQTDMHHMAYRSISELSGGQKQRMFVARALAQQARLILLDEPFAGMDIASEQQILGIFKALTKQGHTIVVVHHDLQTLLDNFSWAILLNVHCIAAGPLQQVITKTNLQKMYRGSSTLIQQLL